MPKKSPDSSTNHNIRTIHEERIRNLIRNAEEQNILIQLDGISYGQGNLPLKSVLMELMGIKSEHVYNDYKRHKIKAPSELVPSDAKGAYIRNIRLRTPQVDHLFEPTEYNYRQISENSSKIIEEIKKEVYRIIYTVFNCEKIFNFQYSKHHFDIDIDGEETPFHQLRYDFWLRFFENFVWRNNNKSPSFLLSDFQGFGFFDEFEPDNLKKFCFNTFLYFFHKFISIYRVKDPYSVFLPVYYHISNKQYLYSKVKLSIPIHQRDLWLSPSDYVFYYSEDCIKLAKRKLLFSNFKHKNDRHYSDIGRLMYLFDLEKQLTIRSYKKYVNRQIVRGRFDIFFSSNAVDTSYILQNVTYLELKQILGHYDISSSLKDTLGSSDLLLLSHPLFRLRRGTTHQCDTDTFLEALKATSRENISLRIIALLDKYHS